MKPNPTKCGLIVLAAAATTFASAADLHVGPDQRYPTLASVPFWNLLPGDNVLIHYKPGGYHESFQLMKSGTADRHITVRGVPDSVTGQKPVIDGQDAKVGPSIYYGYYWQSLYTYGGIIISPSRGFKWGDAPSYIDIEGLEIRNFNQSSTMTNLYGQQQKFDRFAAGIYGERVRNLTVKNCSIRNNGNGIFVNSKYGADAASSDILIENNKFLYNGNANSLSEHHVYTECDGITIQFNTFGPLTTDAGGSAIKDRSAGTIIRYNTMHVSKFGIGVNLVGPQGGSGYLENRPGATKTYFYGNSMINPPVGGPAFIYFGSEGLTSTGRKGTLYSYHNTFINHADGVGPKRRVGAIAYRLGTNAELGGATVDLNVDSRNNVFQCVSETRGLAPGDLSIVYGAGPVNVNFGRDWMSPGASKLLMIPRNWMGALPLMTGLENLFPPDPCNDPGLLDARLLSPATNTAAFLSIATPTTLLSLLDPNVLIRKIDLRLIWKCVDMVALAKVIDPALVVGVVDPNVLVGVIDPNVLVGVVDPNDLVGVVDPNVRPGVWANINGTFGPSPLIGAAGPLSPDLPADLYPTLEYRASGRSTSNWKTRSGNRNLSIGAFEPQR